MQDSFNILKDIIMLYGREDIIEYVLEDMEDIEIINILINKACVYNREKIFDMLCDKHY